MKQIQSLFILTSFMASAFAHSWNDVYYVQSNDKVLGYPRAYPGHIDAIMVRKLEAKNDGAQMCQGPDGTSADNTAYSDKYPMLTVNAGDVVETTYLENGHVTKDTYPGGKIAPGQTQFYWTGDANVQMKTYGDLTDERKLGDPQNFDDGKCAEDATKGRAGPLPCKNSFTIPADTKSGTYQVVWLWKFTKFGDTSHFEWYSTCADFKVNAKAGAPAPAPAPAAEKKDDEKTAVKQAAVGAAVAAIAALVPSPTTAPAKSAGDFSSNVVVTVTSSKVFGTCKRKIAMPTGN